MYKTKTISTILITFSLFVNNLYCQIDKNETNVEITTNNSPDTVIIKNDLKDVLKYKAFNKTFDNENKMVYLLTDAQVDYQEISITADYITINLNTHKVSAYSKIDSTGRVIEKASIIQDGKESKYESFSYNYKTGQGIVYNGQVIENNMVIDAQVSKRYNDSIYYMRHAIATGDEYYMNEKDTVADYYFAIDKAKFIEDNALIAGATQMYIEQVPTPLVLPFLYVPLRGERSAGLILPSFGETEQLGFYLQGLGVYTPIGQYFDFELLSDLYSKGSTGIHARSMYKKNYKFSGNLTMDWENRIQGIKGLTTGYNAYTENRNFRVGWVHTQDRKANPNFIFRANVNYSSSNYYRQSTDNNNVYNQNFLNNTSNSSISFDKYFNTFPMNISFNSNLNQNFNTEQANLTLPQINANLSRQYPFQNVSKVKLLSKLYFDYRMITQNTLDAPNSELFKTESFKKARNGMKNSVSVGTQTTLFNYFPMTFSGSLDEIFYLKTIEKYYDPDSLKVVTRDKNGFSAYSNYRFNSSISTALYGTAFFDKKGKGRKIQAIRHTFQPSVSYSSRPDFSESRFGYYDYYTDADGEEVIYSKFQDGIYGSPPKGLQSAIGFNIGNNLEMKVRSKEDSTGVKKIKIFDYLNIGSSYNMAADSLKMSNIDINGSTSFFDNKFKLNYRANINPYKIVYDSPDDASGQIVNDLGYFSLSNYNIALNFTLNNAFFGDEIDYAEKYNTTGRVRYDVYYFDDQHYAHFNIPWSANIGLRYDHNRGLLRDAKDAISVSLAGRISPSPYWEISANTSYDFVNKELAFTRFTFSRDLRSFVINFNWVPFGSYRSWNFGIYIKSSILRDALKYDDRDYRSINRPF